MAYSFCFILLCALIYVSGYNVPIPDEIVIVGDANVLNLVRNLYYEVLLPYNVPNFKVIVWHSSSYDAYKKYGIPVEYPPPIELEDKIGSTFQYTEGFTKKINDRYKILLYLLKQNRTILNVDSDLWFFENPLNLLNYVNPDDDITFSTDYINDDYTEMNVGLMHIKPTKESIELFERILKILKIGPSEFELIEQGITNLVLHANRIKNLKYGVFDIKIFAIGFFYFRYFKHFVDDRDRTDLKLIGFHNNCINGGIAKIYRLKELGLWKIDDNEYYSSKTRKYIRYRDAIIIEEIDKYESIIFLLEMGKMLNRTVILPRYIFHEDYGYVYRSILYVYDLTRIDNELGNENYRESISFFKIYNIM